MAKFRYKDPQTGRTWVSDSRLSDDELDEVFGEKLPAPSEDPNAVKGLRADHPWLTSAAATAARTATPIIGGAVAGLAAAETGPGAIAAAAAGYGAGGALGESLAEKIEGRPQEPLEIAAQGVTNALLPGPGKTVARGVIKHVAHGLGSVTLDALAKGEGPPSWMNLALGAVVSGVGGATITKLHMRSALKEVLPGDVADEAHSLLTTGKLADPTASPEAHVEAKELSTVIRKLKLGKMSSEVKKVVRGPKGRFQSVTVNEPVEPVSLEGLKVGDSGTYISTESLRTPKEMKGLTAFTYEMQPPARLFDRIQKQTGLPVYDEVFKPVHDTVHDREALEKELKRIQVQYLDKGANVPKTVQTAIRGYVEVMKHAHDGTYQNMVEAVKQFRRRLPIVGKEISDQDAQRLVNTIISSPQLATLAFRVGPATRVLSHIFQTGYMQLGERGLASGIKGALSRQGWREAITDGALKIDMAPEEIAALEASEHSLLGKLTHWGYTGIRGAANLSRVITHLGQKAKTANAIRAAGGNVARFIDKANLDIGIPEAEAQQIVKLYQAGQFNEAITRSGIARADASVPAHSRADRAIATTRSTRGRIAGSLSTWPNFYGNLLYESFIAGPGSKTKKATAFARWAAANAILSNFIAEPIYRDLAGYDEDAAKRKAEGFTFLSPIFYEGGPAVSAMMEGVQGAKETYSGRGKYGQPQSRIKGLAHTARALQPLIPYSYAIEDLYAAGQRLKKTLEDR